MEDDAENILNFEVKVEQALPINPYLIFHSPV